LFSYIQIAACHAIILKYADELKEIFINLISTSSYPAITGLDVGSFFIKCKVVDADFKMEKVDRSFIASNFQMSENPKF
jgi:hypothetical protein